MASHPPRADRFRYDGFDLDPNRQHVACHYSTGGHRFTEQVTLDVGGEGTGEGWRTPAAVAAARLLYLVAGVSYYKTAAPPVVDLGDLAVTEAERALLWHVYVDGLAEFAFRQGLDLSRIRIEGGAEPVRPGADQVGTGQGGGAWRAPVVAAPPAARDAPSGTERRGSGRPLVPFGGGIDSIVTAEAVRARHPNAALFVVSRAGDRFEAIERAALATGLPVVRAWREIDPGVLRSGELGFLNGHVPVTGILSAIAVLAAVVGGHDAVVMANEWSASVATRTVGGRPVNHQYSKSLAFEKGLRRVLEDAAVPVQYFSLLRPYSELWVARRFAELPRYHATFRSCNRSFVLDPAGRLDHWCGRCDKCCFVDLILAPFVPREQLVAIFGGREPLEDPALAGRFRALLGTSGEDKPFECVGDVGECRTALLMAAERPDRSGPLLASLAAEVRAAGGGPSPESLLAPMGEHCIPDEFALEDQLV